MSDRIKVVGYSQRQFFDNGIEYRNFSPDLVGLQLTSDGGTPLFTMGNFSVTTNLDPKKNKRFVTTKFSNFITLTDLDLTLESASELLTNNAGVILNLDKRNLTNYALFGSLREFVRVSLENIITNWPAALYANPVFQTADDIVTQSGFTIQNYAYDSLTNEATFMVNTNVLTNRYQINYLQSGTLENTFNEANDLRNLTVNYESYSVMYNDINYDVIGFTGSTDLTNDFLYFQVKGNVFSGASVNDYLVYYIKPNEDEENLFFNGLSNFEYYLLNRQVVPKYTSTFNYTVKSDGGAILYVSDTVTWPVSDGYNLDFDTTAYDDYATKLLDISTDFDLTTSNLIVRFLVTEAISSFDTVDIHLDPLDEDTSGQKMNKTLTIYGREFDNLNTYITGIKFANTVSYDKNNNTPDIYLKNIARVLGWDLISSVLENDLLKSYIQPKESTFSGESKGLTPLEADIELWRRIILNTPWIWKSKGTRKAVEFLFKFIGTPLGLISFNEYIYLAQNRIDVDLFRRTLELNGLNSDISNYPVTISGYPKPLINTPELYFQSDGLWYRETGGDSSIIDINSGNNPHVGLYDGGNRYLNQFRQLIPNFTAVTISSETKTTTQNNLFTNYNLGTMSSYSGNTYVDVLTDDGVDFSDCYVVTSQIIEDPRHRRLSTDCGCDTDDILNSLSVCIDKQTLVSNCIDDIAEQDLETPENFYNYGFYQYNIDGTIYPEPGSESLYYSPFVDKSCCSASGNIPYYWNEVTPNFSTTQTQDNDGVTFVVSGFTEVNSGYICCQSTNTCGCKTSCKWRLNPLQKYIEYPVGSGINYLFFVTETGQLRLTSQDGCNCMSQGYTIPVQITDPITNEVGFGCQLTQSAINEINLNSFSIIEKTYENRAAGRINCTEEEGY